MKLKQKRWKGKTEPAEDGTSTLEPPSSFMNLGRDLSESSFPGKVRDTEMRLIMDSPRRRRIGGVAYLGNLARRRVGSSPQGS